MQWKRYGTIAAALIVISGGAYAYWLNSSKSVIPEGFAMSNGRIEAERIDIATRFSGRLAEVLVAEGDMVRAGDIVARLDAAELQAQLAEARAAVTQAKQQLLQARALDMQRQSEQALATHELERTLELEQKGFATAEQVDQRQTVMATANAAISTAQAQIAVAEAGIVAANARVNRLETNLRDMTLVAPHDGRIQYRLAEPGEVIAAGGKVLTLIDLTSMYMTIFLPANEAARISIGSDARIVLAPLPEYTIPAKVVFVASQSQYTPRSVETNEERDKLMFRVRLDIPADLLKKHEKEAKAGVRGVGYVPISPDAVWPDALAVKLPE